MWLLFFRIHIKILHPSHQIKKTNNFASNKQSDRQDTASLYKEPPAVAAAIARIWVITVSFRPFVMGNTISVIEK